jgi:hypothetical protein
MTKVPCRMIWIRGLIEIILMTLETVSVINLIVTGDVAILALQGCMFSCKRELCCRVIE